jgi:hypothetical protein
MVPDSYLTPYVGGWVSAAFMVGLQIRMQWVLLGRARL